MAEFVMAGFVMAGFVMAGFVMAGLVPAIRVFDLGMAGIALTPVARFAGLWYKFAARPV